MNYPKLVCGSVCTGILVSLLSCTLSPQFQSASAKAQSQNVSRATIKEAQALFAKQEWAQTAVVCEELVKVNPYNGAVWNMLGFAHHQLKHFDQAIPAFQKAAECGINPATQFYNIACAYALKGEKEQAMAWLEKAMKARFSDFETIGNDSEIDSLRSDPRFKKLVGEKPDGTLSRDEQWRYDLQYLASELKRLHYSLYNKLDQARFEATVAEIDRKIPSLKDHQIIVELVCLAAAIGDGHTLFMPPTSGEGGFHKVPVQFSEFKEGIFVTAAAEEYKAALGMKLSKIGKTPVEQAYQTISKTVSRDNDIWLRMQVPRRFGVPEYLHAFGMIPSLDEVSYVLTDAQGKELTLSPKPRPFLEQVNLISVRPSGSDVTPLYLKDQENLYWYEYLKDSKTVFFQYNGVQNKPEESIAAFVKKMFAFINANEVERLIIDLRWNGGGNNFLNKPLVQEIIKCEKINQPGKLFVIMGRNTFSAAICGASDLQQQTQAMFVGEPSASPPNFIGESTMITLPFCKLRASISSLYWQNAPAMDYRVWIAPDLAAEPTYEAFVANRDLALEAIFNYGK